MDARADMARELTVDEAKALFDSGWWKKMDASEAAHLQLHQDRLCMPFGDFHRAMQKLLGRPVFTHEFAVRDALIAEADGKREAAEADVVNTDKQCPHGHAPRSCSDCSY